MKIINQHLGLPVICLETSERVGDVTRFVTDQVTGRIVAVAVRRKWYQEPCGVAFSDCAAFGQNVVLIRRLDALQPLAQMEDASLYLDTATDSRQRTAITEGGLLLGTVTDEAFDEVTGEVIGYRLDVLAETGTGRTVYIPHSVFVTASATVAILQDSVLDEAYESLNALAAIAGSEESAPDDKPDAWRGAEDFSLARPAAATEAAVELDLAESLDAAAEEHSSVEGAPPPLDQEALFMDMQAADVEPEEAPVTTRPEGAETLAEVDMADPAPASTAQARAESHDRVMMALSLGRQAGAAVSDNAGNPIVRPGETVTLEMAQSAARAGKLYELWSTTTGEAEG